MDNNKYPLNTYLRSTYYIFTQIKSYPLYIEMKPKNYNRFNKKKNYLRTT